MEPGAVGDHHHHQEYGDSWHDGANPKMEMQELNSKEVAAEEASLLWRGYPMDGPLDATTTAAVAAVTQVRYDRQCEVQCSIPYCWGVWLKDFVPSPWTVEESDVLCEHLLFWRLS